MNKEVNEIICIVCPKGCHLQIDEDAMSVTGASCEKGISYGIAEIKHPTRMLTSTVRVSDGEVCRCPVKTDVPIPKEIIMDAMECINRAECTAPVEVGDVIIENVCGTGSNIVASRSIGKA